MSLAARSLFQMVAPVLCAGLAGASAMLLAIMFSLGSVMCVFVRKSREHKREEQKRSKKKPSKSRLDLVNRNYIRKVSAGEEEKKDPMDEKERGEGKGGELGRNKESVCIWGTLHCFCTPPWSLK